MKQVTKEQLNKYIKTDIEPIVRDTIIDVLNLLSNKGYGVIKYIKRINDTEFRPFDPDVLGNGPMVYEINGERREIKYDWKRYEGFVLACEEVDENNEPYIAKQILAYNLKGKLPKGQPCFRQKVIHEFLHLLSSRPKVLVEDYEYVAYTGVLKYKLRVGLDDEVNCIVDQNGMRELNEAITDYLSYLIYKELYDDKFFIPYMEQDGERISFTSPYYLTVNMLRIINLFTTLTNSPKVLLDIYLENDLDAYLDILNQRIGMDSKDLFILMYEYEKNMNVYLRDDMQGKRLFERTTISLFKNLVYNFNVYLNSLQLSKQVKEIHLKYITANIRYLCNFPLFKNVKEEFLEELSKVEIN